MKAATLMLLSSTLVLGCEGDEEDSSPSGTDGDETHAEVMDEDGSNSDGADGDETNGESTEGDGTNGDVTDGDEQDSGGNDSDGTPEGGSNTTIGEMYDGEGTYYDFADGSGACMFDPSPDDMDIAALNSEQWEGSAWCGACADVAGPNGNVRVRIVDLCPECSHGHLDFSPQAFDKIAERAAGRVPISWQFVACDVQGPVSYKYKDGANQWWTAVQVRNHRLPVTDLEWSSDGNTWNPTVRQDYNYFLDEGGFGPSGVRVRVTAVDGQVIEDELPAVEEYLEVEGTSQFQ
jgi:expansin (peptidoglycan-binding protein)